MTIPFDNPNFLLDWLLKPPTALGGRPTRGIAEDVEEIVEISI
jgi:hypothetical protein